MGRVRRPAAKHCSADRKNASARSVLTRFVCFFQWTGSAMSLFVLLFLFQEQVEVELGYLELTQVAIGVKA